MLNPFRKTKKGLLRGNTEIDKEVVIHSFEAVMRLLLDGEDEIALNHVGDLLGLSLKENLVTVFHASLYLHSESFLVIDNLATLAVRAVLSRYLTSSAASVTSSLHLHLHAEADLNLLHHNTLTVALWALLGFAILGSGTAALRAVYVSSNGHISACAKIEFLQSDPNISSSRRTLLAVVTSSKSQIYLLNVNSAYLSSLSSPSRPC